MKKLKLFFTLLLVPILLTSCWDAKTYERVGFILQVGIERSKDKLLVSYNVPVVVGTSAKEQTEFLSTEVTQIREFREKARRISSKIVEGGKIQQLLFSEDVASKGLSEYFELFERDNILPSTSHVVIVDGSPSELMSVLQNLNDKPLPAFYVNSLIENNIRNGYSPESRISSYTTRFFSRTIDAISPVIRIATEEGKGIKVVGTALFSQDNMVGRIDSDKTPLLLSLMGNFKGGEYIATSLESDKAYNKGAAIALSKVKRKLKIRVENDKPLVDISLSFNGRLEEFKFGAVSNLNNKVAIQEAISKEMSDMCLYILKYSQDVGSDPLGIGEMIRAYHNPYWQSINNWKDTYKDVEFNVNVDLILNHYGVVK